MIMEILWNKAFPVHTRDWPSAASPSAQHQSNIGWTPRFCCRGEGGEEWHVHNVLDHMLLLLLSFRTKTRMTGYHRCLHYVLRRIKEDVEKKLEFFYWIHYFAIEFPFSWQLKLKKYFRSLVPIKVSTIIFISICLLQSGRKPANTRHSPNVGTMLGQRRTPTLKPPVPIIFVFYSSFYYNFK